MPSGPTQARTETDEGGRASASERRIRELEKRLANAEDNIDILARLLTQRPGMRHLTSVD